MKASDRLRYNQKQAKFKHNCHLLVYPGHCLSKPRIFVFRLIAWLVGCVFNPTLECTRLRKKVNGYARFLLLPLQSLPKEMGK